MFWETRREKELYIKINKLEKNSIIINLARRPVTSVVGGAPASVSAILLV